jgi:hypothetical protein
MPRKAINPKSLGSLRLAATQAGLAAGNAINDQVTAFKVVPVANKSTIPATFGAPASESAGASSWTIEIAYLQDWGKANSMSEYLLDNDAELLWFRFDPSGSTEPGFEGQVYVTAGAYGGPADQNWEDTQTWACPVTPTLIPSA